MLTSPTTAATRAGSPRGGLVVSFQLAEGQPAADTPDLHRLARAVEDLIRAAAPTVISTVTIEGTPRSRTPAAGLTASGLTAPGPASSHPRPARFTATPVRPRLARSDDKAGEIEVDYDRRALSVDDTMVELTRREFDLLAFLHRHHGQAFSRDDLMDAVWHTAYLSGDRTVDVHIRRLRVKLGRHADRLTTLRGFGYRFD